jgi:hypothetical protein
MGLIFRNLQIDDDPFGVLEDTRHKLLTVLPIDMDEPVARACASYRLWQQHGTMWTDLDTVTVTEQDRVQAHKLKRYYRESMTLQALRGRNQSQSEFRRKLGALVTDQLRITKTEIGLLHRLPYFYHEDLALDRVVAMTQESQLTTREFTGTFYLAESVLRSRRSQTSQQYWLTCDQDPGAFVLTVAQDNPLKPMWQSLIQKPRQLRITVYPRQFPGYRSNRTYYQIAISEVLI